MSSAALNTFYGSGGKINIWDTAGPVNNDTSIAQVAVIRYATGPSCKIEHQGLNGDLRPHLRYSTMVTLPAAIGWGYIPLSGMDQYGSTVAPGMSLAAWEAWRAAAVYP
jgi:hypothetical protein